MRSPKQKFCQDLFLKLQDAAFTSIQSAVYARLYTTIYKFIFDRYRPYQTNPDTRNTHLVFKPFSGKSSFPSGHATIAFALVTPWFFYYPHWSTALLFLVSIGTCIARLGLDKHWTTDVMAGAAIGFFTGYYLAKMHQKQFQSVWMTPLIDDNNTGLNITFYF